MSGSLLFSLSSGLTGLIPHPNPLPDILNGILGRELQVRAAAFQKPLQQGDSGGSPIVWSAMLA